MIWSKLPLYLAVGLASAVSGGAAQAQTPIKNIVLVHGAFADGSGWRSVYDILTKKGYKVSVVQEPETSLAADIEATERVLNMQDGPVVLVGHSWGGQVITEAGMNPKVKVLVYVAALAAAEGESVDKLESATPADRNHVKPAPGGFLMIDPANFDADFAQDVPKDQADYMAHSQVLLAAGALKVPVKNAAWKHKPTFGIVPQNDHIISPTLERWMYKRANAKVTEVAGSSHAVYVSHPDVVASVIQQASEAK